MKIDEDVEKEHANAEAHLAALHQETSLLALPDAKDNPRDPTAFVEACEYPECAAAIDCEYNPLFKRNIWTYIEPTPEMNIIAFLWIFRLKMLDVLGLHYICKARCCVRGDVQELDMDINLDTLHAPVASHQTFPSIRSSLEPYSRRSDLPNAYLYRKIDIPVYMYQPTDSSQRGARSGMICRLK